MSTRFSSVCESDRSSLKLNAYEKLQRAGRQIESLPSDTLQTERSGYSDEASDSDGEGSGGGAGSGDGSGDEDVDKLRRCTWRLKPAESVYDDGMLRIVRMSRIMEKRGIVMAFCNCLALVVLISCNGALQLVVVNRVFTLVYLGKQRSVDRVFSPKGSCRHLPASSFDFVNLSGKPRKQYWFCGPVLPLVMSENSARLDTNQDGNWSRADNLPMLEHAWMRDLQGNGNLTRVFLRLLEDAKHRRFHYQQDQRLSKRDSYLATMNYTSIPMTWMFAEKRFFKLCNTVDSGLCGNFELRDSLVGFFPLAQYPTANDRVDACRDHIARCESIFGEIYRAYRLRADESCGDAVSVWDHQRAVIMTRRGQAQKYDHWTNKEAITTWTYEVFLLLVLIIWWLAVITEVREVMNWWAVILLMPRQKPDAPDIIEEDENLEIKAMSIKHKMLILIMINLPRTAIILLLAYIGTEFLIVADDYTDLILNSVALGFLIEVDDMLFAAVTSEAPKKLIRNLKDLKGYHYCCECGVQLGKMPTSIPYIMLVVGLSLLQGLAAYRGPLGKFALSYAYRCLCHDEGDECIAAQVIGGDHFLKKSFLSNCSACEAF